VRGRVGVVLEVNLRSKLIKKAKEKGFFARNINDRFNSSYPDFRLSHQDYHQMDVELKILRVSDSTLRHGSAVNSGLTRLQAIELRDMNAAGMLAVGLIYVEEWKSFVFCNTQRFVPNESSKFTLIPFDAPMLFDLILIRGKLFATENGYYAKD
jgi:hypothetical protein